MFGFEKLISQFELLHSTQAVDETHAQLATFLSQLVDPRVLLLEQLDLGVAHQRLNVVVPSERVVVPFEVLFGQDGIVEEEQHVLSRLIYELLNS